MSAKSINHILFFNPQGLANTAWAYAKLAVVDEKLMHSLAAQFVSKIVETNC